MIIDISSYNGTVDYYALKESNDIERVILRSTLKNGILDSKFIENLNGAKQVLKVPVDCYKFTYAGNFGEAYTEALTLLYELYHAGVINDIETIYLDIEPIESGRTHTTKQCAEIISAYELATGKFGKRFGIYCNYSYLKSLIPRYARSFPIWLARWNDKMGDVSPFTNVEMWQYTDKGRINGITTDVDLSRYVGV